MKNCVKIAQGGETIAVNLKLSPSPRASCHGLQSSARVFSWNWDWDGAGNGAIEAPTEGSRERETSNYCSKWCSFFHYENVCVCGLSVWNQLKELPGAMFGQQWQLGSISGGPHGVWAMQPSWPRARVLRYPEMSGYRYRKYICWIASFCVLYY